MSSKRGLVVCDACGVPLPSVQERRISGEETSISTGVISGGSASVVNRVINNCPMAWDALFAIPSIRRIARGGRHQHQFSPSANVGCGFSSPDSGASTMPGRAAVKIPAILMAWAARISNGFPHRVPENSNGRAQRRLAFFASAGAARCGRSPLLHASR